MSELLNEKVEVFTDGATVGHNGKLGTVKEVGIGVYAKGEMKSKRNAVKIKARMKQEIFYSEKMAGKSNNEAEFKALITGLDLCLDSFSLSDTIVFNMDSQIVVNRMNGRRPKGKYLNTRMDFFQDEALKMAEKFENISFQWIPREENTIADGLSKEAVNL